MHVYMISVSVECGCKLIYKCFFWVSRTLLGSKKGQKNSFLNDLVKLNGFKFG